MANYFKKEDIWDGIIARKEGAKKSKAQSKNVGKLAKFNAILKEVFNLDKYKSVSSLTLLINELNREKVELEDKRQARLRKADMQYYDKVAKSKSNNGDLLRQSYIMEKNSINDKFDDQIRVKDEEINRLQGIIDSKQENSFTSDRELTNNEQKDIIKKLDKEIEKSKNPESDIEQPVPRDPNLQLSEEDLKNLKRHKEAVEWGKQQEAKKKEAEANQNKLTGEEWFDMYRNKAQNSSDEQTVELQTENTEQDLQIENTEQDLQIENQEQDIQASIPQYTVQIDDEQLTETNLASNQVEPIVNQPSEDRVVTNDKQYKSEVSGLMDGLSANIASVVSNYFAQLEERNKEYLDQQIKAFTAKTEEIVKKSEERLRKAEEEKNQIQKENVRLSAELDTYKAQYAQDVNAKDQEIANLRAELESKNNELDQTKQSLNLSEQRLQKIMSVFQPGPVEMQDGAVKTK